MKALQNTLLWAVLLPALPVPALHAQQLLNGSFELTTQQCGYNLSNTAFNAAVSFASAYGFQNEVDVISGSCGSGAAYAGSRFIALYANNGSDSIALQFSQPLEPGSTYYLHFADRSDGAPLGLSPGRVQIGLSELPGRFGRLLHEAPAAFSSWTAHDVAFQPDAPYSYLTVTLASSAAAWVFVDGFELRCPAVELGNDTTLCRAEGLPLRLAASYDWHQWSTGSQEAEITATAPGWYWVEIRTGGCLLRDSILITEFDQQCDCPVFVPDAFTPNGDGINDTWMPQSSCAFAEYEALIYNRWGRPVFHTRQPAAGWGGLPDAADPGVYAYRIRYRFPFERQPAELRGMVQVFR
jgi:gliding motility-associated-like protein